VVVADGVFLHAARMGSDADVVIDNTDPSAPVVVRWS
jgi:hypothetical protein